MAVKINISGLQMHGGELLSGMNVRGNSEVDIDIKNSSIGKNSQVLNDVKLQNGKLTYRADGVKVSENARIMNGRDIKDGETVVIEHKDTYYTETTQRPQTTQRSQAKPSSIPKAKKESILEKLAKVFTKGSKTVEQSVRTSNNDSQVEFINMINGNGEYRKPEYSQVNKTPNQQREEKQTTRVTSENGR